MYIVLLKFGQNRANASQWMTDHNLWLADGFTAGAFLLAGSLDDAQGGVVIARDMDQADLLDRINRDPFVVHGVVVAEVQGFKPSRLTEGLRAILEQSPKSSAT